jgi:hypothetical protein
VFVNLGDDEMVMMKKIMMRVEDCRRVGVNFQRT